MSAVVAGAFAAGYVGWYVKQIAAAGPWGAGLVGYAVIKGLKKVDVGVNIPLVSLSFTVNIP
ncbi:hypothetical protein ACQKKK_24400 [Peribacillus sp. NPDC006672]|uniref:hypothetical protein n=1 Tax=Peribacillus sp. NPDC006672 TaxID=3390606 RepID=UPI003D093A87